MLPESVTNLSLIDFETAINDKKVVIFHPQINHRNLFLAYFLKRHPNEYLYYRVPYTQKTMVDFCEHLIHDFRKTIPHFGQHTTAQLAHPKPKLLGEALAQDIAACVGNNFAIFVLDELDRVILSKTLRVFFVAIVDHLPANVQLVINSRTATYDPWTTIVRRGDGTVLGTENRWNNVIFSGEDQPKPQLEVYGFGRGQGLVNGQLIENWDGTLPRNLFFYFVDHPSVTRDQVFEIFWPQLTMKEATNVFHVTKRKITERIMAKITVGGEYELISFSNGFYVHSNSVILHYDVAEFDDVMRKAERSTDDDVQIELYRRAIDLYRGQYLDTLDLQWVKERRERLKQSFIEALIGLSRILRKRGEHFESLTYFLRTLHETPLREDIHREVMRAYLTLGKPKDARQHYEYLVELLQKTFNVSPARETRELYESIGD